jgi:hypothetical protein
LIVLGPVLALALGASLLPPASPLETLQPARPRTPGVGRVVQATSARAYLDAGSEEGLAPGLALHLQRGDQALGHCTVETVGPNTATCTGLAAKPGDTFRLEPMIGPQVKVVTLPSVPSDEELARRAAVVVAAPVAPVDYKAQLAGAPALVAPHGAVGQVSLGDAFWSSSGVTGWDVVTLDASVHGAAVGPFTLDLDLSAQRWVAHSGDTFRPKEDTRLYVWQAQLGWAPTGSAVAISAGRVLPWTIPGATAMDGAVIGWRKQGWEAGLFGGLVPQPDTLGPTSTRSTAGGYWILDHRSGDFYLRQEGRLAYVRSPELGTRLELEANASLHTGAVLDLFGSARAAVGKVQAPALVDVGRLELSLRPVPRLAFSGGFEYGGLAVPYVSEPPAFGSRNRRADLSGMYDLGSFKVGASGGFSHDSISTLDRAWFGPEVQLPRFFTHRLDLSLGYLEELGWLHGRSGWIQAVAKPWDSLRLIGRASWAHESSLGMDPEEVGLSLSAVAELTRAIGLRATLLGHAGFSLDGESTVALGLSGSLSVYALF